MPPPASLVCWQAWACWGQPPLRCVTLLPRSCRAKHVCLQAAWVTLLWHASIPRPILLAQLHETGHLQALLNSYSIAAATDPMLQLARDVSCKPVPHILKPDLWTTCMLCTGKVMP